MTDPTPDATSAFERACAAGWNATHPDAYANWDWVCRNDPEAADIWRRSFAAALRELREPSSDVCDEPLKQMPEHANWLNARAAFFVWQAMLDAILKDAP